MSDPQQENIFIKHSNTISSEIISTSRVYHFMYPRQELEWAQTISQRTFPWIMHKHSKSTPRVYSSRGESERERAREIRQNMFYPQLKLQVYVYEDKTLFFKFWMRDKKKSFRGFPSSHRRVFVCEKVFHGTFFCYLIWIASTFMYMRSLNIDENLN